MMNLNAAFQFYYQPDNLDMGCREKVNDHINNEFNEDFFSIF